MADLIATERATVMSNIDSTTARAFVEVRATVDHLMLRILQMGALALMIAVLGGVALMRFRRQATSSGAEGL